LPSQFEPILCLELKISPRHVSKTSVYGRVSVTRIEDFLDPNTPTPNSQRAPLGARRFMFPLSTETGLQLFEKEYL
jgi:hypothetical protein